MAVTWPWVSGGTSRLHSGHYPLRRNVTFQTGLVQFVNGSEQRWKERGTQNEFTLEYQDLHVTDKQSLNSFVAQIGAGEGLFHFDMFSGAGMRWGYSYCRLIDDSFTWTQEHEGGWNGTIRFRQYGVDGGVGGGAITFPAVGPVTPGNIYPSSLAAFPFVKTDRYLIDKSENPLGVRTAYLYTNKGLSNFPNRALHSWDISFPALNNHDASLIEQHFITMGGRYQVFAWTDPSEGRTYNRVRYDTDVLEIVHLGMDLNSVHYRLTEVFGEGWTS